MSGCFSVYELGLFLHKQRPSAMNARQDVLKGLYFDNIKETSGEIPKAIDDVYAGEPRVSDHKYKDDGLYMTLNEIASELGVTQERVRQIEAKALRKLRHPSNANKLKEFYPEHAEIRAQVFESLKESKPKPIKKRKKVVPKKPDNPLPDRFSIKPEKKGDIMTMEEVAAFIDEVMRLKNGGVKNE